jgi:hypothetical protein
MAHDDTRSNLNPRKDDDNVGGNLVGEGVGGVSGIATGAALGSLGGPVGTVIGALAGAIGGWWSGRAISEAAASYTDDDDSHYQSHYKLTPSRTASAAGSAAVAGAAAGGTGSYDDVRPAYQIGHIAGRNPDYAGRSFDEVEGDLRRGWTSDVSTRHGEWDTVRHHARDAYERGRGMSGGSTGAAGTGIGGRIANAVDDMKDRVDGNPASRPGRDATDGRPI